MPGIGADIVGQSSEFDQTDWLTRSDVSFLAGKKDIYISWFCKSDVSNTENVPLALGRITGATPLFFRHAIEGVISPTPDCWSWGYIFSDASVRFESPANTGSNNKLQHIACQIRSGAAPRMWINGVEQVGVISRNPAGTGYPTGGLLINDTTDDLMIGRGSVNSRLWDGLIDEVRIIEDVKDSAYVAIEYANLININDFVVSGDVETPITKQSPIGELIIAAAPTLATTRIRVDRYVTNPNSDPLLITNVSTPSIGSAVKVNDSFVDYTAPSAAGQAKFNVTFSSGGKTLVVPIYINVSTGGVPPDITDITLLSDRVSWSTYVEPPGFQGYQPKESPSDAGTWADSTNVGALTPNKFVLKTALKAASRKVLVKPFANGRESVNAAEISLIVPPTGINYWSSPNYGTKSRQDVNNHEQLMNALGSGGINPSTQYINMTYTDNIATTISRGGTLAHPLIVSAQAPSGLTNFTGRAGFTNQVKLTGNYIWLDRLKFKSSSVVLVRFQGGSWNFVTRCQLDFGECIQVPSGFSTQEWWIGFNEFIGLPDPGYAYIHVECTRNVSTNPRKGRIYYNTLADGRSVPGAENASIMSGPGLDAGGAWVNVEDTWVHYNYLNNDRSRGIYCKHGMDVKYNHVVGHGAHAIAFRGACVGGAKIEFNRTSGAKMLCQGERHLWVGNIGTQIEASCDQQGADADKPIIGANYNKFIGNDLKLSLGVKMTNLATVKANLHDVTIEKHTGSIVDNNGNTVVFGADGRPVSNQPYIQAATIIKRATTTVPLFPPPTLSPTTTGPGASGGKVWGT